MGRSYTKKALALIAYYWGHYTLLTKKGYTDKQLIEYNLNSVNTELDFAAEHKGVLARIINHINTNVTLYTNGTELLDHILDYCDKYDYLAPTFCARFKRKPLTKGNNNND